jgi:hypothetical protein
LTLITRSGPSNAPDRTNPEDASGAAAGVGRSRKRAVAAGTLTALAGLLVFVALVIPDQLGRLKPGQFVPGAFLRIPLEGIAAAALIIVLPARARRVVATLIGMGLGVTTVLKILNIGFLAVLARRFDPVLDWPMFGDGFNALTETSGRPAAIGIAVGAVVLVLAMLVALTLSVQRLARVVAPHPKPAKYAVTALVAAWAAFALLGSQLFPGAPVASDSTAVLARNALLTVPSALHDRRAFAAETRVDAFRDTPGRDLLTALRGKDVVVSIVESYGRSALENPQLAAVVDPALATGARQLAAAGFSARSAFLTSSTYGGGSWLAHASFQSGLWIDNQQRYRHLMSSDRLTLTKAFQRAGWNTVGVEPGNTRAWPEATFYGYNQVYDSRNLQYQGPRFGWSRMPDQYTLASFQRNVYAQSHPPLMAEITLTSSHEPWTPIPELVDWNAVANGAGYGPMAAHSESRSSLFRSPSRVRAAYAKSIAYSVGSLASWAQTYGKDNLVLVFFGDHQAAPIVSGHGASHDVPVTIVAKDPAVLNQISGWGWQAGIRPDPHAPVWTMDGFRDRFLTAFATPAGVSLQARSNSN